MMWSVGLQAAWFGRPFPENWTVGRMRDADFYVDPKIPDEAQYIEIPPGWDYSKATGYTYSADQGFMFRWYVRGYVDDMLDAIAAEVMRELDMQILDELRRAAGGKPPPRGGSRDPEPMTMV